ncbi:MAG: hypothetical protein PGN07_04720 [Aeromicrobium erythreum]
MADIDVDALRALWSRYGHAYEMAIARQPNRRTELAHEVMIALPDLLDEVEHLRAKVRAVEAWLDGPDRYVLAKLREAIA